MTAQVASLEHLTGPSGGTLSWLGESSLEVAIDPSRHIHIAAKGEEIRGSQTVAHLRRVKDGFEITAEPDHSIWVNKKPVKSQKLNHLDMIEFDESGPMSRYYLHDKKGLSHRTVKDILSDSAAYFRTSRQPFTKRILNAMGYIFRRLAVETTIMFRVGVIVSMGFLIALAFQQYRLGQLLKEQVDASSEQLESFSSTLARA